MLHWRLLLGVCFSLLIVGACWLDNQLWSRGLVLVPFAGLIAVFAAEELVGLCQNVGWMLSRAVVHASCLLLLLACALPHWFPSLSRSPLGDWAVPMLAINLTFGFAFWEAMQQPEHSPQTLQRLAGHLLATIYLGFHIGCWIQMLWLGPAGSWGLAALASLLIAVKMGDIGAYTIGRIMGRHRLAPQVSPGKTIEGFIGGFFFALLGIWIFRQLLAPAVWGWAPLSLGFNAPFPWQAWLGWASYAILVNLMGVLGDLAESLLKRSVARKDSSFWMPGFGGVLDLIDSPLIAAPMAYFCWVLGAVSGG